MTKLLQINTSVNCSAHGRIAERIGAAAISEGWDAYIVHGARYKNPSCMTTIQNTTQLQERLHGFKSMLFDGQGLGNAMPTKKLVRKIEKISPDIIHLHNIHGYYMNYQVLFDFLAHCEKPVVWTLHDYWPITGHCPNFAMADCEKWKTYCHRCPLLDEYPKALIDKSRHNFDLKKKYFTSVKNMHIVTVSDWQKSIIDQSFLSKYPVRVINNGVNTDVFRPSEMSELRMKLNLEGKFVLIGVASQWRKLKGLFDFIELSKLLPDDCRIVMVGMTEKQIAGLPEKIVGIGHVSSQHELAMYYSMADVVLNLSFDETFGLTTIEGMACGTPGIVYNVTASSELISESTGYVVEKSNFTQLLDAISKIKNNGKQFYSENCVNRVKTLYDDNNRIGDYIRLYKEIL